LDSLDLKLHRIVFHGSIFDGNTAQPKHLLGKPRTVRPYFCVVKLGFAPLGLFFLELPERFRVEYVGAFTASTWPHPRQDLVWRFEYIGRIEE
jgi:hypothetical protein